MRFPRHRDGSINEEKAELKEEAKAKNCIECGSCEAMCPQKLSIREDLKALRSELDAVVNR